MGERRAQTMVAWLLQMPIEKNESTWRPMARKRSARWYRREELVQKLTHGWSARSSTCGWQEVDGVVGRGWRGGWLGSPWPENSCHQGWGRCQSVIIHGCVVSCGEVHHVAMCLWGMARYERCMICDMDADRRRVWGWVYQQLWLIMHHAWWVLTVWAIQTIQHHWRPYNDGWLRYQPISYTVLFSKWFECQRYGYGGHHTDAVEPSIQQWCTALF